MAGRHLIIGVAAIALIAGACGDDPPTAEEIEAIDSLVEADLSTDEQRCILDGIGALEITVAEVIAGDLSAEQDGEVLAATLECVEDLATVEGFVDSFIAGAAEEGTELTRDEARCAIRALDAEDQDAAILACLGDRAGRGVYKHHSIVGIRR